MCSENILLSSSGRITGVLISGFENAKHIIFRGTVEGRFPANRARHLNPMVPVSHCVHRLLLDLNCDKRKRSC